MIVLEGRVGLALGSGSARGLAHVGVIRALEEAGIRPEVVCGSSIGAAVGAFYAAGELGPFEAWARSLEWRQVVGLLDLSLRGGLFHARRVFEILAAKFPDRDLESLAIPFGAVATDLASGQEVWLRSGSMMEAVRASIAIPGMVTPRAIDGRWLVDGGLVNPVPVTLCRAMGAETVIAVDLNTALLPRRVGGHEVVARADARTPAEPERVCAAAEAGPDAPGEDSSSEPGWRATVQELAAELRLRLWSSGPDLRPRPPSIYEVMANGLNIMQHRITRSRMAGDPPDLLITPRLADFGLIEFDRAAEAIEEGRRAVARALSPAALGLQEAP
jgi:NTE family protein